MTQDNYRSSQFILFFISLLVLAASFYFQFGLGLEPCPLCIMQRVCVFLIFVFTLFGLFSRQFSTRSLVIFLQMLFGLAGLFFAARQLWLQSLPPEQLAACLPGLEVLMRYFPWHDILQALLWGSADCGEVKWHFLGLTMPAWSGIYFIISLFLIIGCIFLNRKLPAHIR